MNNEISINEVSSGDITALYLLRNKPEIRENMFDSSPLDYKEHSDYWNNRINNKIPSYVILISGIIIGYIKLDMCNLENKYYVGIIIMPGFQGRGYGKKALGLVKEKHSNLMAKVFPSNIASIKLFEAEGFKLRSYEYEFSNK
jgi:RimJ/RimL family protein N-acetyltransferase